MSSRFSPSQPRWLAAALVLLALACGDPNGVLEVQTEQPRSTISGRLQVVVIESLSVEDDDAPHGHELKYYLVTPDEVQREIVFPDTPEAKVRAASLSTGALIEIDVPELPEEGPIFLESADAIAVQDMDLALAIQQPLAAGPISRKVAVVLFNFRNDTRQPFTTSAAREHIFTGQKSMAAYFNEVSYGAMKIQGVSNVNGGDVFGWYTLPVDNTVCEHGRWADLALERMRSAGINTGAYQHFIFSFPRTAACNWPGLAHIPGTRSWIQADYFMSRSPAHEFSHNLAVDHSNALECKDSAGRRVAISGNCTHQGYGDPFDIMGAGGVYRHYSAFQRARLGLLTGNNIRTLSTDGEHVVDLIPLANSTTGTQVLRIPRGNAYLYVEYRQPSGLFDNWASTEPVVNGLSIRLAPDASVQAPPALIDNTPSTATFNDSALPVGATFRDSVNPISIQLVSRSSSSARVKVTIGNVTPSDTTAPTVALSAPTAGAVLNGTVTVSANASDNIGVVKVEFFAGSTKLGEDTSSPFSFSWNTKLVADGSYRLTAKAHDKAGNVATSAGRDVTVKNSVTVSELVANGGFENASSSPWVTSGAAYYTRVDWYPRTGIGYAYFGAKDSVSGTLSQDVTLPAGSAPTLTYWMSITSNETGTVARDIVYVELLNSSGTLLKTLATHSNLNKGTAGVYTKTSVALGSYAGQKVKLRFRLVTNATASTTFRLDDVSIK